MPRIRCDACGRPIKEANDLGLCPGCTYDHDMLAEDNPWAEDDEDED